MIHLDLPALATAAAATWPVWVFGACFVLIALACDFAGSDQ